MTGTATVPRAAPGEPAPPPSRDRFGRLLHAEWTKFRTVRGWVVALGAAVLVTLLMGWVSAAGSSVSCSGGPGGPGGSGGSGTRGDEGAVRTGRDCLPPPPPVGPEGLAVTDSFFFVHRTLAGDGSITVRVTSLTGRLPEARGHGGVGQGRPHRQGRHPARVLLRGGHGHRRPRRADAARLHARRRRPSRRGHAGRASLAAADPRRGHADGARVGRRRRGGPRSARVRPAGLPATVEAGLFVTSPDHVETTRGFGGGSSSGHPTLATAGFDQVSLSGAWRGDAWRGDNVGGEDRVAPEPMAGFEESGGRFSVTASGDIAPLAGGLAGGPTSGSS